MSRGEDTEADKLAARLLREAREGRKQVPLSEGTPPPALRASGAPEGQHTALELQQHLALTAIGSLLQRRVDMTWKLRGSARDIELAHERINEAMRAYHATASAPEVGLTDTSAPEGIDVITLRRTAAAAPGSEPEVKVPEGWEVIVHAEGASGGSGGRAHTGPGPQPAPGGGGMTGGWRVESITIAPASPSPTPEAHKESDHGDA